MLKLTGKGRGGGFSSGWLRVVGPIIVVGVVTRSAWGGVHYRELTQDDTRAKDVT